MAAQVVIAKFGNFILLDFRQLLLLPAAVGPDNSF